MDGWILPFDRVSVRFVVALTAVLVACCPEDSAQAFDFFGLWSWGETPPPVSRTAISYAVTINVEGDGSLKNAVQDASSLYKLRKDAPPDGDALARRAQSDFGPIIDAMWGAGYYDATVTISIDGASLSILSNDIGPPFARCGELPQPRRRSRVDQRQSGTAVPSPLAPRARAGRRGAFGSRTSARGSSASSPATPRRPPNCAPRRRGSSTISEKKGGRSPRWRSIVPVVDHAAQCDGPDVDGRSGADRPVRRSDDERAA